MSVSSVSFKHASVSSPPSPLPPQLRRRREDGRNNGRAGAGACHQKRVTANLICGGKLNCHFYKMLSMIIKHIIRSNFFSIF